MKKNRMMRLASILLVCVLLTTSVISGTFAKYTSTVAATDTARVAKWDWAFIIDEQSLTHNSGESVEFDLFNASQIMDLDNATGKVSENADDAVVDGLIAPGTGGKFNISVQNKSEVAANYTVALTATESIDLPIEYSLDNTTWKANISDLPISGDLALGADAVQTSTVYWRWVYEAVSPRTNADDTALGNDGTHTLMIKVTITATQVD